MPLAGRYIGLDDEVTSIDYDGDRLVAGTKSGDLRVWETTDKLVKEGWEPGCGCQVLAGTTGARLAVHLCRCGVATFIQQRKRHSCLSWSIRHTPTDPAPGGCEVASPWVRQGLSHAAIM